MDYATLTRLDVFSSLDGAAVGFLIFTWLLMGFWIDRENPHNPSTHHLIRDYRYKWFEEMARRDVRIMDTAILDNLRQGASFFASAAMIAIGGGAALLRQTEQLQGVAADLTPVLAAPRVVWEAKILLVILILTSAFLKFVWSVRLFGYNAVVLGAVPNDGSSDAARSMARKAAKLNIHAARSFNGGMRAMYFALAAMAWILGPWPLILATGATALMLYRREFHSRSRRALLED